MRQIGLCFTGTHGQYRVTDQSKAKMLQDTKPHQQGKPSQHLRDLGTQTFDGQCLGTSPCERSCLAASLSYEKAYTNPLEAVVMEGVNEEMEMKGESSRERTGCVLAFSA